MKKILRKGNPRKEEDKKRTGRTRERKKIMRSRMGTREREKIRKKRTGRTRERKKIMMSRKGNPRKEEDNKVEEGEPEKGRR